MTSSSDHHRTLSAVALDGPLSLDAPGALDQLCGRLAWPELRRYPYGVALDAPGAGLVYLFAFGAVVVAAPGLAPGLRSAVEAATGRSVLDHTQDSWTIEVGARADGGRLRVGWDRVVLPALSPDLIAVTALLLAQSAVLERFEEAAEQLVEEALAMSEALVARGRPRGGLRGLARQVGRVNRDRLLMAKELYILDRPEETWTDAQVAALYDELLDNLELATRQQALLSKLQAVEGATELVIDLRQSREANRLEWAIVLLIVVEVLFTLWEKLGPAAGS